MTDKKNKDKITEETDKVNDENKKENVENKNKNHKKDLTGIIVISIFILVLIITGGLMFQQYNKSAAMEQCKIIENHPDLAYPCVCIPADKPEDIDPYIDEKTEKYCRCTCDIGNNQTYIANIVRAKE